MTGQTVIHHFPKTVLVLTALSRENGTMKMDAYLEEARERQVEELKDWLRIPSISTLSEHADDIRAAAAWLADRMKDAGLENVEVIQTDTYPLVYADWLNAGPDQPTVLVYGHYDVQPVDPLDEWDTPPFEPTVKGDDIFARGAADDKGQAYVHVKAVEALLAVEGKLPVNIKFIIEGEEESGGAAIGAYLPANGEKLAADVVMISDTHMHTPTLPIIAYGLRGMWSGEITVTGPATDLHSGLWGGVVHNPNQALAELLASLHDADGRITVPGFYDKVRELEPAERASMAKLPFDDAEVKKETGVAAVYGEPAYTPNERTGARPTLEINGMWGGFTSEGFKTVIPSKAHAKISCRLVPDQDPAEIGRLLEAALRERAPKTISVEVVSHGMSPPFISPMDQPVMQAASRAFETGFGAPAVFNREGGSIPVVSAFSEVLGAPVVFLGFGLPDDNLHAPNEKFHLPNFWKGIRTSIAFLHEVAKG